MRVHSGLSTNNPGSDLLSHAVTRAVPSAVEGLTSVFGMGTGVTPLLCPPGKVPAGGAPPQADRVLPGVPPAQPTGGGEGGSSQTICKERRAGPGPAATEYPANGSVFVPRTHAVGVHSPLAEASARDMVKPHG